MDFNEYLDLQKQRVGQVIDNSLQQFKAEDWQIVNMMGQQKYASLFNEHWAIISDYPSRRGKYLRPTLVLLMAEAMSGSSDTAMHTAAAMQMSEDWILIHDDWEDGSLERRGKPALHRLVSSEIAINAGDTLHECMHRVLCENFRLLDVSLARRVQHEFFLMLGRTTFGQYAEILWTQENKNDMNEEDVLFTVPTNSSCSVSMRSAILSDSVSRSVMTCLTSQVILKDRRNRNSMTSMRVSVP